jgi:hypothetical protein
MNDDDDYSYLTREVLNTWTRSWLWETARYFKLPIGKKDRKSDLIDKIIDHVYAKQSIDKKESLRIRRIRESLEAKK